MKYACECCGNSFESTWSDADARAEKERVFPDVPFSACAIVCDDCYQKIMAAVPQPEKKP